VRRPTPAPLDRTGGLAVAWPGCPDRQGGGPGWRPLWANLKDTELANLVGDTLEKIIAAAEGGIQRIRATPNLPFSFLRRCGPSPVVRTTSLEPATFVGLAHAGSL
jgi:hypothetical protein